MFDYLVIGKGLMGSAAARYLSQLSSNVAIIGPDEPPNWATHDGVFASHYDQGRVTQKLIRRGDAQSTIAARAIDQYQTIESQSGIKFHEPRGSLLAVPKAKAQNYLEAIAPIQGKLKVTLSTYDDQELKKAFPYLQFPPGFLGVYEPAPAGYINPRALIKAQLAIASQQGASIIKKTVTTVKTTANAVIVTTSDGEQYKAQKVLIATGAFANCFNLLSPKLALRIKTETIILAKVPKAEAMRLQKMPVISYSIESSVIEGIYLLPPILYPDENYYIKMGCDTAADKTMQTLAEMQAWFQGGGTTPEVKTAMENAILSVIPNLAVTSFETKPCAVTYTAHGQPYIDTLESHKVFIATGGNGGSANSSDALGCLAAGLVEAGAWVSDLDKELFQAHFVDEADVA